MSERTINVYGCGGTGINVARMAGKFNADDRDWAKINTFFVDTSHANATADDRNFYYIEASTDNNKEGSGRVRRDNAGIISNNVKAVLNKFHPSDFNIVVFSAHGGSGSVAGPMLLRELLSRDIPAIAIVQGGDEDAQAAKNALATIASLDDIARNQISKPVIMAYGHTEPGTSFDEQNRLMLARILYLSRLFSGNIEGLDNRDLANWMNFSRTEITGMPPQLAQLQIANNDEEAGQVEDPISAIVIRNRKFDAQYRNLRADFEKSGYAEDVIDNVTNQYFLISTKNCQRIFDNIRRIHQEYEERKEARVSVRPVSGGFKTDGDTGMIF